jgi:hypothetical protein
VDKFTLKRPGEYLVYSSREKTDKLYVEWDFGDFNSHITGGVKVIPKHLYKYESVSELIEEFGRSTVYLIVDTNRLCDVPVGSERVV